ncbi:hypothetical protein HYD27_29325 [Paenibacillus sp. S150]|nr:hypothetical protein [Paenibacillus sp. S150]MBW4085429.1 hypothetical protein [Paenibacillus sp. S150]
MAKRDTAIYFENRMAVRLCGRISRSFIVPAVYSPATASAAMMIAKNRNHFD